MNYGICVIGYNRLKSLQRLLQRLSACDYYGDEVALFISLDKWKLHSSAEDVIVQYANDYLWPYGSKHVITYSENQGLKKHILQCGDLLNEYNLDAMAVFEDDVLPSLDFYGFMRQAVPFYYNENRIAGIALYSYRWNPISNKPFEPLWGKGDTFLIQSPASWGQIWLKEQWNDFRKWYNAGQDSTINSLNIPYCVKTWERSWLKYHIAYCVATKRYFVYPYCALSTCYSEQGEHAASTFDTYQVPLVNCAGRKYQFYNMDDIVVRYDAFFESAYLEEVLRQRGFDTTISLYGDKEPFKRYYLSSKNLKYNVVQAYALTRRPHEVNILDEERGNDIFLYDTESQTDSHLMDKFSYKKFMYYFNGSVDKRFLLLWMKNAVCGKLHRK